MQLTRSQIRKLVKEFDDLSEDRQVTKEYWDAIRSLDMERLQWFGQFGETVRHRIMNAADYRGHVAFGYPEIKLDESGWLESVEWVMVEDISLKTAHKHDKNAFGNYVTLAQGRNGKWTFSTHFRTGGGSGGGYSPFPKWHQAIRSRNEALTAGLDEIKKRLVESLERNAKWDDPTNVTPAYVEKVLTLIEEAYPQKAKVEQLTLFA